MKFVDTDNGTVPITQIERIVYRREGSAAVLSTGREVALREEVIGALTSRVATRQRHRTARVVRCRRRGTG